MSSGIGVIGGLGVRLGQEVQRYLPRMAQRQPVVSATDKPITRRELILLTIGATILAIALHWPIPIQLGTHIARDLGDPIVQAWQVAWGGHALTHQPLSFFQANQFWPLPDSLAFSDALIGYAPAGLVGDGVTAAVVRYNVLFLFAYALAFVGAYLLARELRLPPSAAAVAGAAFAYTPWRLEQDGHLHVISSGGIPLALFLLARGYRQERSGMVLAGWLVAAWQVSLGFSLGLQLGYLIGMLGLIAGIVWWRKFPAWRPKRRVVVVTAAGAGIVLLTAVLLSLPYQRVLENHPEAERTAERVAAGSGPVWQFAAAPKHSMVWGEATRKVRENKLTSVAEQTLFPGLVIFCLALVGVFGSALPRWLRFSLAGAAVALAALSLGFRSSGVGQFYPYRLVYEFAPGWQGVRVPGRLHTLTTLALALLAAGGTATLIAKLASRGRRVAVAVAVGLVALICIEGIGFEVAPADGGVLAAGVAPRVPREPIGQRGIADPQLHLPITIAGNRRYVFWSTDGFPKIVNGRGSIDPASFERLSVQVRGFPDRGSVRALRELGVKSVVLHPYLLPGTYWWDAATKPIDGLGITRVERGELVVYSIN